VLYQTPLRATHGVLRYLAHLSANILFGNSAGKHSVVITDPFDPSNMGTDTKIDPENIIIPDFDQTDEDSN